MTVLLLGLVAAPLAAQEQPVQRVPRVHSGFWIGVGAGLGYNMTDFGGVTRGGFSGYFRLGGTVSQRLMLGFEVAGWGKEETGRTVTRANGSFVAAYYPSVAGGFFAKAGIGGSSVSDEQVQGNTTTTVTEDGLGATVGAGYDIRLGRNMYLTPNLDVLFQFIGRKNDPVLGNIPGTNTIVLFTLGLTWH